MKLSRLAFSPSRFKWPVLVLTVGFFGYMTYLFIVFMVRFFMAMF